MVAHTYNLNTQETEGGRFAVSFRPAWLELDPVGGGRGRELVFCSLLYSQYPKQFRQHSKFLLT